jgi:hypothetical protein
MSQVCANAQTITTDKTHCSPVSFFPLKNINLEIEIESIPTRSQLSNQPTKGLPQESFEKGRLALMGW